MRYFRNTRNMTLSLSNPNVAVRPGQVKSFSDDIVQNSSSISSAIGKGILVEVSEGSPDLDFNVKIGPTSNTVVSAATDKTERIVLNDGVYVPGRISAPVQPVEEATIIVKGSQPGEGTEKPLNEVLKDAVNVTVSPSQQSVVSSTLPVTPVVKLDAMAIPDDLKAWFQSTANDKKMQLIRINSVERLSYIGGYDTDPTTQKLIAQRIAELRG